MDEEVSINATEASEEIENVEEDDEEEEPGRKERVFWKHVFGAEYQE